jgi:hypothetical protein
MEREEIVCVGYRLAAGSAANPGEGTYLRDGYVHARFARPPSVPFTTFTNRTVFMKSSVITLMPS